MRIQRTSQIIIVVVIGLPLPAVGCALRSLFLRNLRGQVYETRRESLQMAGQLNAGGNQPHGVANHFHAVNSDCRRCQLHQGISI